MIGESFVPSKVDDSSPEQVDAKGKKSVVLMTGTQMERPLRHLAGLVKEYMSDEYEVDIINLGTKEDVYEHKNGGYPETLRQEVIDFILEKKPTVIGITMIDFGIERLSELIKEIAQNEDVRNAGTKVIAGGPFAIEHPERCIDIEGVDVVCYSKGWNFADIVEACSNDDLENIPGLMVKTGIDVQGKSQYFKTPPPKLKVSLSDQPLPDESLERTYLIYEGRLVNAGESGGALPVEHHQVPHKHTGVLVTSEGCPNDCEFCSIPAQQKAMEQQVVNFFKKQDLEVPSEYKMYKVRFLEARKAVDLIKNYLKENPKTEYILFNDNDFFARGEKKMEEFAKLYKEEVGLPFYCQGSPNTISEEKIRCLVDAGMDTLDTGVQGSEQANERAGYDRNCTNVQVLNMAKYVAPHLEKRNEQGVVIGDGLKVAFDFINGNDVHTKEDMLSTIVLTNEITSIIKSGNQGQGSWNLAIHNLTLDTDRQLAVEYRKQREAEGIVVGEVDGSDFHNATVESFYKLKEAYLNIILQWMGGLHDQVQSGQLPRKTEDFALLIEDVLAGDSKLAEIVKQKKGSLTETIDFLTDDDVYTYLSDKSNSEVKETLIKINKKLPKIQYSYQRPDRYDKYDYSWAEKQIAEK